MIVFWTVLLFVSLLNGSEGKLGWSLDKFSTWKLPFRLGGVDTDNRQNSNIAFIETQGTSPPILRREVVEQLIAESSKAVIVLSLSYFATKLILGEISTAIGQFLHHPSPHSIDMNVKSFLKSNETILSKEEEQLVSSLLIPDNIVDDWKHIGGLTECKRDIWNIASDLHRFSTSDADSGDKNMRFSPVRSVLLHGPPGCGKVRVVMASCSL
jgi:ATP-dependent 26S proteasome regulatory subunit